jgi:serine/threonine-protein kinase
LFLALTRSMHGFEKMVVLKRILPQYASNPQFVNMFLTEARLAATLDHPNIAHVYDIGEHAGSYYFSMEYVHGASLLKVMRAITQARRPLPLEHALNVVIGVCAGLNYAHFKVSLDGQPLGIVHRDVSPPNVILTFDGGVKVLDFGIAKAAAVQTETAAGTLKGKVPYMSPEQCRAEPLDHRSDIFSIGILLYELTVGRRLFQAESEVGIIHKIVTANYPRPTELHPNYPPQLEEIVLKSLDLDRDNRFDTARDLQVELEDFAREYKLPVSSAKLAHFMEDLFDQEARKWPTSPSILENSDDAGEMTDHPAPEEPDAPTARSPTPGPPNQMPERPPVPGQRPAQGSPPSQAQPTHPELQAFGDALSKLLDGGGDESTAGLGPEDPADVLGIDLDNLEVEELVPGKFSPKK